MLASTFAVTFAAPKSGDDAQITIDVSSEFNFGVGSVKFTRANFLIPPDISNFILPQVGVDLGCRSSGLFLAICAPALASAVLANTAALAKCALALASAVLANNAALANCALYFASAVLANTVALAKWAPSFASAVLANTAALANCAIIFA